MLGENARLLIAALAVYRWAQLITLDDGPLYLFRRLRLWAGRMASAEIYPYGARRSIADFLNCPYCMGVYMAGLAAILVYRPTLPGDLVLLVSGLAGAQTFLEMLGAKQANEG